MQAENGEFFPEKDLNFRIPKRKADQMQDTNYQNTYYNNQHRQPQQGNTNPQTPLANSYYNYQYPYNVTAYPSYYTTYQMANLPPPPPPPEEEKLDPVTKGIFKALTEFREKPKTQQSNIFHNTVPDMLDESLPKELKSQFQPLYCKLCLAQLSSNMNAKTHYKSRNHEKKIRKWLVEYSEKTGEPLHKRAKVTNDKQKEEAERNPAWFHCEVCDLPLTGKIHAESHYMGKNHQKVLTGKKTPTGSGFYNDEGKWVRLKSKASASYNFENGDDNFGCAFKSNSSSTAVATPDIGPQLPKTQTKFYCEVCNISTTCQEQLDSHYRGSKHQKKLKQLGLNKYNESRALVESVSVVAPPITYTATSAPSTNPILLAPDKLSHANQNNKTNTAMSLNNNMAALPMQSSGPEINLSVYVTPSGDYYCPSCNATSNSNAQFVQHMKSKSHLKKAAGKKN